MTQNEQLPDEGYQSLTGHLTELRKRIVRSLLFIIVGFGICFSYSEILFDVLRGPISPYLPKNPDGSVGGLVFLGVTEKFTTHIKISLIAGAIITAPFWLYQVWAFIAPGLYRKERRFAGMFVVTGSLLFFLGAAFAYYLALPSAYEFLLGFGGTKDLPMITISEHISFLATIIIVFGVIFEMPLILVMLGLFGIIHVSALVHYRRIAIVVISVLAAIFSPPDVMSMILVMVPMVFFYEISIIILKLVGPKKTAA